MRKVLVVLMGLILTTFMVSCSEDSTSTEPWQREFSISTTELPDAYYCTPYNIELQATGGVEPYTWELTPESDPLPEGLSLTAEGQLMGVLDGPGEYNIIVQCTDDAETPNSVQQALTINVVEPNNPSLAVFFDGEAEICSAATEAFSLLDCYVYIMIEGSDVYCTRACEFLLRLEDANGVEIEAGTQYGIINVNHPEHVAVTMGDLFNGIAISFNRPMYGPNPIEVVSFSLMLMEDLDNLSFKFSEYPNGILGVATCDAGYPEVNVSGREAAINY